MNAAVDARILLHGQWMAHGRSLPNDDVLAQMLATHYSGGGSLPVGLGLNPAEFAALLHRHFPGAPLPAAPRPIVLDWDPRLLEERDDLIKLLQLHRANRDPSEIWMSQIVAAGCMAPDHLWQDLGLWSRRELSDLMMRNFPALATKNDRDMKWKKFLYKQLCQQEGIYLCRAPSCEVCTDYSHCFGPES